jgi:hypothetical protein
MEKLYIGTIIISAEPEEEDDGTPGHKYRLPGGNFQWLPKEKFDLIFREITADEINLISFVSKKEKEA